MWQRGPQANNGLGFSVAIALVEMEKIERFLTVLRDSPAAYWEWNASWYSTRLLDVRSTMRSWWAAINVNGVRRILTFNTEDFARYDIEAIHPSSLLS